VPSVARAITVEEWAGKAAYVICPVPRCQANRWERHLHLPVCNSASNLVAVFSLHTYCMPWPHFWIVLGMGHEGAHGGNHVTHAPYVYDSVSCCDVGQVSDVRRALLPTEKRVLELLNAIITQVCPDSKAA
jgi:hypothetical protein